MSVCFDFRFPTVIPFTGLSDHRLRSHIMMAYEPHLPWSGIITSSSAIGALARISLFIVTFIIVLRFFMAIQPMGRRLRATIRTRYI